MFDCLDAVLAVNQMLLLIIHNPCKQLTMPSEPRRRYWRKTLRVTCALLLVWFLSTFGVIYFARFLTFTFFGWPFSFWMSAQGSLLIYCAVVAVYARYMSKLVARNDSENRQD